MTDKKFKEIVDNNKEDNFNLCYQYYLSEAKGTPINESQFYEHFSIWLMFMNVGDVPGGLQIVVNFLKSKHNYK